MKFPFTRSQIALAAAATFGATTLAVAPTIATAHDSKPRTTGTYAAGDFHNHSTCSDGSISMQKLVKKSTDKGDTFQLVDGLQVIGIANLRGLRDTTVPMWIAAFGYWAVGFPTAWLLGFHTPLAGTGIWIGLASALATVGVIMMARFERLTRRMLAFAA